MRTDKPSRGFFPDIATAALDRLLLDSFLVEHQIVWLLTDLIYTREVLHHRFSVYEHLDIDDDTRAFEAALTLSRFWLECHHQNAEQKIFSNLQAGRTRAPSKPSLSRQKNRIPGHGLTLLWTSQSLGKTKWTCHRREGNGHLIAISGIAGIHMTMGVQIPAPLVPATVRKRYSRAHATKILPTPVYLKKANHERLLRSSRRSLWPSRHIMSSRKKKNGHWCILYRWRGCSHPCRATSTFRLLGQSHM